MDWVHCNNCFLLPDREKCFYLTSCGHIFCRDCEGQCIKRNLAARSLVSSMADGAKQLLIIFLFPYRRVHLSLQYMSLVSVRHSTCRIKGARGTCKLCGNQCTSIPLSSSMKPDVQVYFTDPDELLKAKLREVQKISAFQRNHRARLLTYYRKELNKYRQMKDGFKKILKNLKDLESEKKQLSKENDTLKKIFEMSGLSRTMSTPGSVVINSGNHGSSRKGTISPHCNSAPTSAYMNPMFSQFFNKLDNSGSGAHIPGRVSVFSPPINGKIGGIPGSPSPSTALSNLKLSSDGQKNIRKEISITPTCSQESYDFNFPIESVTSSPVETWKSPKDVRKVDYQHRKDPRRVVVHPYSPDDC